jgi:hypothetical protein
MDLFRQEKEKRVLDTLKWYIAHFDDDFMIKAYTLSTFCQRYSEIAYKKLRFATRNGYHEDPGPEITAIIEE